MLAYLSSQNVTVVTNLQGFVRFHYPGISAGEQHSQHHELCAALHSPWQPPVYMHYTRLSTIRLAPSCCSVLVYCLAFADDVRGICKGPS